MSLKILTLVYPFLILVTLLPVNGFSLIHEAPITIKGARVSSMTNYPIKAYRLFTKDSAGKAKTIPFQIDEVNRFGDYVLDKGKEPNSKTGNNIFDQHDELVLMGNDVGPLGASPIFEPMHTPDVLFELTFKNTVEGKSGAVWVGIYLRSTPPPKVKRRYVVFNKADGTINTSRYKYSFDKKNYLILRDVSTNQDSKPRGNTILDSSTFYMFADLKYFLNVSANHRSVNSRLQAYKDGPIRTIVKVDFYYSFLQLRFEAGMYTEVSFYSNSVDLPAVLHSPLDGRSTLNEGSLFYYGFALHDSPQNYTMSSNMKPWEGSTGFLDVFKPSPPVGGKYWASLLHPNHTIYLEITPSPKLRSQGVEPKFYIRKASGTQLAKANNDDILEIQKAPVNIGLGFDLTKFPEGENIMSFKLFFENHNNEKLIPQFRSLGYWYPRATRIDHRSMPRNGTKPK